MNILDPGNAAFFVAFVGYSWIRKIYFRRTQNEPSVLSRFDRTEKVLLAVMFPPVVLLPMLYLFTPLLAFADHPLPPAIRWAGGILLPAALWLFWRAHADLGRNWSVSLELRENHQLVTRGVYRFLRHPMYASIWLWGFAQAMLLPNWLAGGTVLPAFALLYCLRVPREERMMLEAFGDDYQAYAQRTGRILPRIGRTTPAARPD